MRHWAVYVHGCGFLLPDKQRANTCGCVRVKFSQLAEQKLFEAKLINMQRN